MDVQDDILDQSIRDSYEELKKEFANKTLSEQVKKVTTVRVSEYSSMATIEQLKGLKAEYYNSYTEHILTKFNMPEDVKS